MSFLFLGLFVSVLSSSPPSGHHGWLDVGLLLQSLKGFLFKSMGGEFAPSLPEVSSTNNASERAPQRTVNRLKLGKNCSTSKSLHLPMVWDWMLVRAALEMWSYLWLMVVDDTVGKLTMGVCFFKLWFFGLRSPFFLVRKKFSA